MTIIAAFILGLAAQSGHAEAPTTLRQLVQNIALSYPRTELSACSKLHPLQTQAYTAEQNRFSTRVEGLLDALQSGHPLLLKPVPPAFMAFQSMQDALAETDFRERTPEDCQAVIAELEKLGNEELKTSLLQTATQLLKTISTYESEMQRVLAPAAKKPEGE